MNLYLTKISFVFVRLSFNNTVYFSDTMFNLCVKKFSTVYMCVRVEISCVTDMIKKFKYEKLARNYIQNKLLLWMVGLPICNTLLHNPVLTIVKFPGRVKFRIAFNGHTDGYFSIVNSQFVHVPMEVTHKEERGHIRLVGKRQV